MNIENTLTTYSAMSDNTLIACLEANELISSHSEVDLDTIKRTGYGYTDTQTQQHECTLTEAGLNDMNHAAIREAQLRGFKFRMKQER